MMEQSDPRLLQGENVVFSTKKHWFAPVADSGVAALMIIGALVLAWLQTDQAAGVMGFVNRVLGLGELALFLGGIGWIIYNVVAWRSAEYVVTNLRLFGQEGLLRKRSTDSLLTSISDLRMRESSLGRMLGYGDVQIMSASGKAGSDTFTTVEKAGDLKRHVIEQKVASGGAAGAAQAAPPMPASGPSPAQAEAMATLNSLAALRDSGAITADEYEAKKSELLARI